MIFLFLLLTLPLGAMDYSPWFPAMFVPELSLKQGYAGGKRIDNVFTEASLGIALKDYPMWIEAELDVSKTRHRDYSYEACEFFGQYRWLNDVVGDKVSLTTGLLISFPTGKATREIGLFRQGVAAFEIHAAVGKEFICHDQWQSRIWADFALGAATSGNPWIRTKWAYERQWNFYIAEIHLDTLSGFGSRKFCPDRFRSWGKIPHQSVDLTFRVWYKTNYGDLGIEATQRLYAWRYPRSFVSVAVLWWMPLSL